jgi:hypothetical protein
VDVVTGHYLGRKIIWDYKHLNLKESMPRKLYLWTDDRSSSNFEEDVARTNNRRLLEERRKLARMIWRFVNGEIPSWIYMLKGG